tara:strand:+ start:1699 stop:1845 length:147 start_codon:yes stop_codon:yes gene_type:complete
MLSASKSAGVTTAKIILNIANLISHPFNKLMHNIPATLALAREAETYL